MPVPNKLLTALITWFFVNYFALKHLILALLNYGVGFDKNTNRFLRLYFPKGTDLSVHPQTKLFTVACQLNERSPKTLQQETPGALLIPGLPRNISSLHS